MALTYYGFTTVPVGFIPEQDKGYLVVNALLPDGASIERTEPVVARLTEAALDTPGVAHVISVSGYSLITSTNLPNAGGMFVLLEPFARRKIDPALHASAIAKTLRRRFARSRRRRSWCSARRRSRGWATPGASSCRSAIAARGGRRHSQAAVANLAEAAAAQPGLVGLYSELPGQPAAGASWRWIAPRRRPRASI
jgi:multidrug efflux pump